MRKWIDLVNAQMLTEDVVAFPGTEPSGDSEELPVELDWFTRGYMSAAVRDWYENRRNPLRSWQFTNSQSVRSLSVEDIDRPTRLLMIRDCAECQSRHQEELASLRYPKEFQGNDFYVSRGGSGSYRGSSVFWDPIGAEWPPVTMLYLGRDWRLHSDPRVVG